MPYHGFVRVAAGSPLLRVADCHANADRTIALMQDAEAKGVELLIFPEMGLTGYTCNDLFFQQSLQRGALEALQRVLKATASDFSGVAILGLPLVVDDQIFNVAAILQSGRVLGIVPKTYLPTYKEFYDARYFAPASTSYSRSIELFGREVPFGTDLLFPATDVDGLILGVEICEDLWG